MSVNRSGTTSRSGHGDEAVPTRFQVTGIAPAQRDADACAWHSASRGGTHIGGQPTDDVELGQEVSHGSTGVATQTVGTPQWLGCRAEEAPGQSVAGGCDRQRLCDRTVDVGASGEVDRARVRTDVQHGECLAHPARDGLLQPTPDGSCYPARRGGDPAVARQALAGAKKSPAAKGAPSSSSTKVD